MTCVHASRNIFQEACQYCILSILTAGYMSTFQKKTFFVQPMETLATMFQETCKYCKNHAPTDSADRIYTIAGHSYHRRHFPLQNRNFYCSMYICILGVIMQNTFFQAKRHVSGSGPVQIIGDVPEMQQHLKKTEYN